MILAAMRSKNDSLCGASNVEAAKSSKYFIAVLLVYYFVIKLYYVNIRFDLLLFVLLLHFCISDIFVVGLQHIKTRAGLNSYY